MESIVQEVKEHIKKVFKQSTLETLYYHNWEHVKMVRKAVLEIADNTPEITPDQKEMLEIAAWFHDIGYEENCEKHEEIGAERAEEFLKGKDYPSEKIEEIKKLILATNIKTLPQNILEEIIKDADLAHLAKEDYFETTFINLYHEIKETKQPDLTIKEWVDKSNLFLDKHTYFTAYAKEKFTEGKNQNGQKIGTIVDGGIIPEAPEKKSKKKKKKKKKKKSDEDIPEKGIETMFRVSLRNHVTLSRIADNKANTLISVNGIIISIVLSTLFPKMDTNPFLIYPGVSLITFSIITVILGIFSTIPKTTHGKMTKDEVKEKEGNLLFFGNFHGMSLEDYEWSIEELMQDKDYLYKSLTRDLYFLGKVLHKKYMLLRYSYYIFVIGLVITIALFISSIRMLQEMI